jgi:hypothetical protein
MAKEKEDREKMGEKRWGPRCIRFMEEDVGVRSTHWTILIKMYF